MAYFDQLWRFIAPREGLTLWMNDENKLYSFDGAAWIASVGGGRQTLWIPAALMRPSVSGGCAALAQVASAANQPDLVTLDFDAGAAEYAQFSIAMPKAWNEGSVSAQFVWSHASASTNFAVAWSLQGVAVSDGDGIGAAYGSAGGVTDTGGSADTQYISAETAAITLAGSSATGDMAYFRVARDAAGGADTLAVDARLHGVRLFFTTDALNDN